MLGGGTFVTQNKKLAGAYINFVSAARASATLADRGIAAIPMAFSWGAENEVVPVDVDDFLYSSRRIFGYSYDAPEMVGLREVFKNATRVLFYRLNTGAVKASNDFCEAKFGGVLGNELSVVITANVDEPSKFDVKTILGTVEVDVQTAVETTSDLEDNDFVVWKDSVSLTLTAKTTLTGGTDGTVDSAAWSKAFEALESESFNTLGVASADESITRLAVAWTKRMRDEVGVKFQTVVFNHRADDKGVINVVSTPVGSNTPDLVYWVTGAEAGCKVNASCTNKVYNGELDVNVKRTQAQLEACIDNGEFVFHKVGTDVRVLTDINSKTTVTTEENDDFKSNQTIRVLDQIGNDIASLFNERFLGIIPNDESGRISLWNEIVKHHQELQQIRAIEDFSPENVKVMKGDNKKSVVVSDAVTPVNAMEILYFTCVVS